MRDLSTFEIWLFILLIISTIIIVAILPFPNIIKFIMNFVVGYNYNYFILLVIKINNYFKI